jgi:hypothetical protein
MNVTYQKSREPIVLSKVLFDYILKNTKYPAEVLSLYSFYYYTAKWQETNRVYATTAFVSKGLHWTEEKVRKIKKILLDMCLIAEYRQRTQDNSRILKCYIEVNIVWQMSDIQDNNIENNNTTEILHPSQNKGVETLHPSNTTPKYYYTLENQGANALSNNNRNALSKNKQSSVPANAAAADFEQQNKLFPKDELVQPHHFEIFYKLYPRNAQKGKALIAWNNLCTQKSKQAIRPTWKQVRTAIRLQKKTKQWADPTYIQYPATWINQLGWLNNIEEMNNVRKNQTTNKPSFGYMGKPIEYTKPIRM